MKKTKFIIAGLMIAFLMFLNITIKQSSSKSELTFKFTQVLVAFSENINDVSCKGATKCPTYHSTETEGGGQVHCCTKYTFEDTGFYNY